LNHSPNGRHFAVPLLAFLEAGGEAVIRGMLSRMTDAERSAIAAGDNALVRDIAVRLDQKGYSRFEVGQGEIREVTMSAARAMRAADALHRGQPIGGPAFPIPTFPLSGGEGGPRAFGKVVSEIGGIVRDTIFEIKLPSITTPIGDLIDKVVREIEPIILPLSPPPVLAPEQGSIRNVRVLAVYNGSTQVA
jgi:hypothetical protein